jgi:AraC-like DNA-binding protein
MSFDNFYIILVFSGITLGVLSSSILLFANKAHKHANRLLSFSTIILVLNISTNALVKTNFYIHYPHFFRVTAPLLYMYYPLVYLYIRAIVKDETHFRKWDWLFFIPAFLQFCELLPFYMLPTAAKRDFITTVLSDPSKLNHLAAYMLSPYIHNIIKALLGFIFMAFSLRLLTINKSAIATRSADHNKNVYRWLLTLASTIMVLVILTLFFIFLPIEDGVDINILMTLTVSVIYFLCIYLFFVPSILFGMPIVRRELILNQAAETLSPAHSFTVTNQPISPLFTNNFDHSPVLAADKAGGAENNKPTTTETEKYSYLEAYKPLLEMHLESAKPYLKPGYSINDLSEETGIPLHHLTALLNKGYNERFNDFINKLRLEYLVNSFKPEWKMLTLEGIGKEVGFNSRTTFYNTIKKNTGLSPSAFFENQQLAVEKTEQV